MKNIDQVFSLAKQGKIEESLAILKNKGIHKDYPIALFFLFAELKNQGEIKDLDLLLEAMRWQHSMHYLPQKVSRITNANRKSVCLSFISWWAYEFIDFLGIEETAKIINKIDKEGEVLHSLILKFVRNREFDKVRALAEYIGDNYRKHNDIALCAAEQGEISEALQLLTDIGVGYNKSSIFYEILKIAEKENIEKDKILPQMITLINNIKWKDERSDAVTSATIFIFEQYGCSEVLKQLKNIKKIEHYTVLLEVMGRVRETDDREQGIAVLDRLIELVSKKKKKYSSTTAYLVENLAYYGKFDEALEMANEIKDEYDKSDAIGRIAKALDDSEQSQEFHCLKKLAKIIFECGYHNSQIKVINVLAKNGAIDFALECVNKVERSENKAYLLAQIATKITPQNKSWAMEIYKKALQILTDIDYVDCNGLALGHIVRGLYDCEGLELLDLAIPVAEKAIGDFKQARFAPIVQVLIKSGQTDRALDIVKNLPDSARSEVIIHATGIAEHSFFLKLIDCIKDKYLQDSCITYSAVRLAQKGNIKTALKIIPQVIGSDFIYEAMIEINQTIAKYDVKEEALVLLRQSFEVALKLEDSTSRYKSLLSMVHVAINWQEYKLVGDVLQKIVEIIANLSDEGYYNQELVFSLAMPVIIDELAKAEDFDQCITSICELKHYSFEIALAMVQIFLRNNEKDKVQKLLEYMETKCLNQDKKTRLFLLSQYLVQVGEWKKAKNYFLQST